MAGESAGMRTTSLKWPAAVGLILAALPTGAQTPGAEAGPQAVYSQTVRGVTVQLTRVKWDSVEPGEAAFAFYKTFHVSYRVETSAPLTLPAGKKLRDYITNVAAFTPDGYPLDSSGAGPGSADWNDVDPRWSLVAVDVEFVDPAAPPKATGRSVGPVTVSGIPVPAQTDVDTPTQAETTTPLGTRVIVEKVKISPDAKGGRTTFALRVLPDPEAGDLVFNYSTDTQVRDDTGVDFSAGGGSGTSGPMTGPSTFTVTVRGVPSPGAKTMRLTLDASETSEQLKQDDWYRHFHLVVPLRLLSADARRPSHALATVQGADVTATLDSVGREWGRYRTRLVLKDRMDPGVSWRVRGIRGKDDNGNALLGTRGDEDFFWKTDGSPLAPGESGTEIYVGAPGDTMGYGDVQAAPPGAKMLSLTADVEAFREDYHLLDFPQLPIPAPGQTLDLNRRVEAAPGLYLVLRKVAAYSPAHPLPAGFLHPVRSSLAPPGPSGLAVILAEPPDPKGRTRFEFGLVAADDSTGRHLRPVHSQSDVPGDALQGASPPPAGDPARVRTFFFRTPASSAQTWNLRMDHDQKIHLPGKRETITFPDVPAPPAAGK